MDDSAPLSARPQPPQTLNAQPVARVLDLVDPASQRLEGTSLEAAHELLISSDPRALLGLRGSFALTARQGEEVVMARSLDRPLRFFLAKEQAGPMLVVGERMADIVECLEAEGYADQFHPTYCRMVPAHHVTRLRLIGCPDPNPVHRRFLEPAPASLPADLDILGERYVGALYDEVRSWLDALSARGEDDEPIGVAFSGGIDSGAVLLSIYRGLLDAGQSPARLKAFTLSVDGTGDDLAQAREFLHRTELGFLGEAIEVPWDEIDPFEAVETIEDYKPLDVEAAAMSLGLARGIRRRYPDWKLLADGDGGDENLKDYPIEENPELTIRSVVNNALLYQEGWGVDAVKHSLTYSGGLSRGCVRTWAPAKRFGFAGFSPFTRPSVVAVAAAMPFNELVGGAPDGSGGSHEALYELKGEIVARGVRSVLGLELPVFPKRRFQHGAAARDGFERRFGQPPARYREHLTASLGRTAR